MRVVAAAQMRGIEAYAVNKLGIPSLLLMENAAIGTAAYIIKSKPRLVTVVCGPGNNGGDGLALARKLCAGGCETAVIFVGEEDMVKGDARKNLDIAKRMGIPFYRYSPSLDTAGLLGKADVVADALFGIGLNRAPEGIYAEMIRLMNTHARRIVSLDIPSGVDADTGRVLGEAVRAHATVTYGFVKPGLLLYPGAEQGGEVKVVDISIPADVYPQSDGVEGAEMYTLTEADIPVLLPKRPPVSHKGSFGRVRILAGSRDMPGAAVLCCAAAYRIGAGLVEVSTVEEAAQAVRLHVPEALAAVLPGKSGQLAGDSRVLFAEAAKPDVLLIGPGLGRGAEVTAFVLSALAETRCPVVLDADGLNAVADVPVALRQMTAPCIVTPHPGEMSRLLKMPVNEIVNDPVETARYFARTYQVITLLKGARTVVAAPDGRVWINTTGCAALAKAGSGDALAGMIAGLLAQGAEAHTACALGAYLHGKAGEWAGKRLSSYGVNAMDTINALPEVLNTYTAEKEVLFTDKEGLR